MLHLAFLSLLLTAASARAADLPPGAVARLGDARFRAGGAVLRLALSPDGKQFATVRSDDTGFLLLTVWDSATGRPVRERPVNNELYHGFVWGTGGARAIVIRAEPETKGTSAKVLADDFRVWDFADPESAPPPPIPVSIGIGNQFLNANQPRGGPEYTAFEFSGDGTRVAARWESGKGKHAVHVFELKPTGTAAKLKRVGTLDLGAEGADHVRISADGKTVVTFRTLANDGPAECTATAWDVAAGTPARPVRAPAAKRLMLTPDARGLVLYTEEEQEWGFDHFDLATGKQRALVRWPETIPRTANETRIDRGGWAFTPNGRALVVAIDGKTLVLDIAQGKEVGRLEGHADTPTAVAVSADGSCIATADRFGLVRLWDAQTFRALNDAPGHRAPVRHAELSPDGKRLLTWAEDETVRLWDMATGKELRAFAGAVGMWTDERPLEYEPCATFTPDGTAVVYRTKARPVARDIQTGLEVPLPGDMTDLAARFAVFAPDGKAVLTWNEHGRGNYLFEVWDWPSGKKRFAADDVKAVGAPGFSPDGAAVFMRATDPSRWDAKTGKGLPPAWKDDREHKVHPLLALRPNPRHLLHNPEVDGSLRVIESGTGTAVARFRLVMGVDEDMRTYLIGVWGIALSPAGGQFAVSFGFEPEGSLLCEAATGQLRRELRGHRGAVRVLGFTPDGTKLLTAGEDHTVLVWDVRLRAVPLPDTLKRETNAAKLWDALATGSAKDAYLAMARLAREPDAALKLAKMKLKPAAKGDADTDATTLTDARAVELLEALGTDESRALLKELAAGAADAFRTQEAKRALQRAEKK